MTQELKSYEFLVPASAAGTRLDVFLAQHDLPYSRSQLGRRIDEGEVRLDGNPTKSGQRLRPGQRIRFTPPPPTPSGDLPQAIPLAILHEDRHLIVVNKPAGMVVHPAPGHESGTLVNALLHHCGPLPAPPPRPATLAATAAPPRPAPPSADDGDGEGDDDDDDAAARGELCIGGQRRPGIVHRLDQGTSGVLVCAKDEPTLIGLQAQFQAHTIARRYVALVEGVVPERGTFSTRFGRHPRDRKRFTGRGGSKKAVTHYAVIERLPGATLVEIQLETGRTHQIRVHFSEAGHPVLGDPLYGRTARHRPVHKVSEELGHQALHARLLGFVHPSTGQTLVLQAPPPADFLQALLALRGPTAQRPQAPPLPWEISP